MQGNRHSAHTVNHPGGPVRVLQLTDTHLCRERGGRLLAMDTDHSLQAVIELARAERGDPDLLLATGDLSDHGYLEAYQRLRDYLDPVCAANFWLPGNHDDRQQMATVVGDSPRLSAEIRVGGWQVLMLDSQVPGEVGGQLGSIELEFLAAALGRGQAQSLYTLVCLHHQPVPVGCAWLDEQMVADADRLFEVLAPFDRVRGLLWGHVHQQIDRRRGELQLMASPSTCVQFAPGSERFRADDQPPGYRWLELHEDGRIDTGVSRVCDVRFDIDLESGGYL